MSEGGDGKAGGDDQMEEIKTGITFENEWNQSCIHIDVSVPYEEDYQMRMLENNEIPGIMKGSGCGRDGESRYTYYTGGRVSMEKKFEKENMKRDSIMNFTGQFMKIVENLKDYLLDPGKLCLDPSCIFEKDGSYSFCYVPVLEKDPYQSFHEITEFFVRKLDYRDMEGIYLAYMLHKATLQEDYDLKKILEEYLNGEREREDERKKEEEENSFSSDSIFNLEEEEDADLNENLYETRSDTACAVEEKKRYGPIQKVIGKIWAERWGNWQDLITEIDGQDDTGKI